MTDIKMENAVHKKIEDAGHKKIENPNTQK